MSSGIVTLTTDFGSGLYTAQMKARIISRVPDVRIIDISHDITPQCISEGAFVLRTAAGWFEADPCVHICVVDPTVGSSRKAICVVTPGAVLVGPDNGVLFPAADMLGVEAIFEIAHPDILSREISSVFHGRDVFAPAAAMLAQGLPPSSLGPPLSSMVELDLLCCDEIEEDGNTVLLCRVLHVDRFGNIITSLPGKRFENLLAEYEHPRIVSRIGDIEYPVLYRNSYHEEPPGTFLIVPSSSGQVEISRRNDSASQGFGGVSPNGSVEINIS